ncbi:hypothetical protein CEXT_77671 [Caerostris extrusa]|uniref:Uncharacterized protein n=1 Tax=Caerostris extrusa TaxID=172846 RepID=A0AAV4U5G3_CAEEX|nr:hypothetical protein CEXT_77671 [Caerostris extrusa]
MALSKVLVLCWKRSAGFNTASYFCTPNRVATIIFIGVKNSRRNDSDWDRLCIKYISRNLFWYSTLRPQKISIFTHTLSRECICALSTRKDGQFHCGEKALDMICSPRRRLLGYGLWKEEFSLLLLFRRQIS